jgi:hypothetical protein
MSVIKPNESRSKIAITVIWIIFFLEIISFISGYLQYDLLTNAANGIFISDEEIEASNKRELVIGLFYSVAGIFSYVTFIQWFRRAYYNLHQKVTYLSYKESMALVSWFIPFVNLYRPFQIMRELYIETKDLLEKRGRNVDLSLQTLPFWWTLWIVSNIMSQFLFHFSRNSNTLDELFNLTTTGMILNLIGISLALITIRVIKNYADIEYLLHEID